MDLQAGALKKVWQYSTSGWRDTAPPVTRAVSGSYGAVPDLVHNKCWFAGAAKGRNPGNAVINRANDSLCHLPGEIDI